MSSAGEPGCCTNTLLDVDQGKSAILAKARSPFVQMVHTGISSIRIT
ncbi:MAG: hypothetical protein ACTHJV_04175 [Rhizobiaceae bacterium]